MPRNLSAESSGTNTPLRIRECHEHDLTTIATIEAAVYTLEGPWDADDYREELLDPECLALVATTTDGSIAGYAFARVEERTIEVTSLTTAENFRRLGIGRLLLTELLRLGRAAGATASTLDVREGNGGAIALYTAFGFQPVRHIPNLYDTGVHAVEMRRQLI
jgi:ribosomal-protein-alanine N-acetyltransferase